MVIGHTIPIREWGNMPLPAASRKHGAAVTAAVQYPQGPQIDRISKKNAAAEDVGAHFMSKKAAASRVEEAVGHRPS